MIRLGRALLWGVALLATGHVPRESRAEEPVDGDSGSSSSPLPESSDRRKMQQEGAAEKSAGDADQQIIESLEERIRLLERRIMEMEQREMKREDVSAEQDARLDDLASETSELWEQSGELKAVAAEGAGEAPVRYDDGLVIATPEGRLRLTLNGFIRPVYRLTFERVTDPPVASGEMADAPPQKWSITGNGFHLLSARLLIGVKVVEVVRGVLELEGQGMRLLDAYGEYRPHEAVGIRAGQMRVPFDAETSFRANETIFSERPLMSRTYRLYADSRYLDPASPDFGRAYEVERGSSYGRDVGLQLGGSVKDGLLSYALGAFNGAGTAFTNKNRDVLVVGRITTDPLGPMTEGMADVRGTDKPLLRVGAGVGWDLRARVSQFDFDYRYNSSDIGVTADTHLKWRRFSLMTAVFYRRSNHGSALFDLETDETGATVQTNRSVNSLGATAQMAYFIPRIRLEPAVRYSLFDGEMRLRDDHVHELTAGIAHHVIEGALRVLAEYRGSYPANEWRSYLGALGTFQGYRHEVSFLGEVAF